MDAPDEKLNEIVKVRLTSRQRFRYEQAAAHEGISLSEYIRKQLNAADNVVDELRALRALLIANSAQHTQQKLLASVTETTLLLRSLSEPRTIRSIHSALSDLGLEPLTDA